MAYCQSQQQLVSSYYGSQSDEDSYSTYDSPSYGTYQNHKPTKPHRYTQPSNGGGATHVGVMRPVSSQLIPTSFPQGADPEVVKVFQMVDQDRSGFIDDKELQRALSSANHSFSLKTVHLLMNQHANNPNTRKIGPKEFMSVFYCLKSWRETFERFDRDRSGKIDSSELRNALISLGFTVSPTILNLIVSKYDQTAGSRKKQGLQYDNFIECCLTVKGLTEKFKEHDMSSGTASFTFEEFMSTVLPFVLA